EIPNKVKIIILAAGKGTRMESDLPKVLVHLKGKSLIKHLLEKVDKLNFDTPYIVVGYKKEQVMRELGEKYHYVVQEEQLGTGHAVNTAKNYIEGEMQSVVILYGDQPFTSVETIEKLVTKQSETKAKVVMATVRVPDFEEWRHCFSHFSRIIRKENGKIKNTVEKKDANEEELKIKEVNPCYFCFEPAWLWDHLNKLKNENAQKEYYLTDLIKMATEEGEEIEGIEIDAHEALGANSKEELAILENFLK
ncbi:MAG: NTP transferase domain-containing protein, partial [Candidatus Paceibacterota bacterium]